MPEEYFYFAGGSALILNGILIGVLLRKRKTTIPLGMKSVIAVQVATGILLVALGIILKIYRLV